MYANHGQISCFTKTCCFTSYEIDRFPIVLFLGKDTCSGDSGGPLIVRNGQDSPMWLSGIVSFGTHTCGAGKPAVFTNIKHFIPWIQANLRP